MKIRPRDVEVLRLQAGDTLVYRSPVRLTADMASRITEQLEHIAPEGVKCVALDADASLQVVRGASTSDRKPTSSEERGPYV